MFILPTPYVCYAIIVKLVRIVDSKQPCPSVSISFMKNATHKKGKPIINPIQKNRFPSVLFLFITGSLPTAIIGNWIICSSACARIRY